MALGLSLLGICWATSLRADDPAKPAADQAVTKPTATVDSATGQKGTAPVGAANLTFEADIIPIFQARCLRCHGEDKLEAGLDLRRRFAIVTGGDSGPSIELEKPLESLLLERVEKNEMPPPDEGRLDDKQKSLIRQWILSGAKVARDPEPPLEEAEIASRISEEDRKFWSFQPPVHHPVPTVAHPEQVRNEIDSFLLQKLEAQGLTFNSEAPRDVLLRRLCYDLLGLPPTIEQTDEFLNDTQPLAYERLVDRLLATPQYGERWARHWLDIAGYADSDGYLDADRLRPEAWRYRDYVIDALNRDLPYDQFIREQIAGDEMSNWRQADELTPEMIRQLSATGFLRTALDPTYPGYTEPNEIHQVLADTMQIVSTSFLGLTVHCARCHSHKFDPVSQRDYYAMQSVFLSAYDPARWIPSGVRGIQLATESQEARIASKNKKVDERVAALNASIQELTLHYRKKRVREMLMGPGNSFTDAFHTPTIQAPWKVSFAGTAQSWKSTGSELGLTATEIQGKPGYALVRLTAPVLLTGEFQSTLSLGWKSEEGEPNTNQAMQGILLTFRDAMGKVIASQGYIDENNDARGSPVGGISTAKDPLGADLIEHHTKVYKQAIPPTDKARSLPPVGQATVTIVRDAAGQITTTFESGTVKDTSTAENSSWVTTVEIEFRRFVLEPGATFPGVMAQKFQLTTPATGAPDPMQVEKVLNALIANPEQRNEEQKQLVAKVAPNFTIPEPELVAQYPDLGTELAKFKTAINAEQALKEQIVLVRGLIDMDQNPAQGKILKRGDHSKPGAVVDAGVPEILASANYKFSPQPGYKTSGRRTAFAHWLTDPQHPLVSRVHVNRVWARHFGRAFVHTQANFGRSGMKPSHPELLDWLATEFVRLGWSQKSLHRLMLTSAAYRQSSAPDTQKSQVDPDNALFGAYQPRRLEGEVLRDTLLMVSGRLNSQMAGAPTNVALQGDGSVIDTDDLAGRRRTVYQIVRRSQHMTLLGLFDTPVMEVNCPERNSSIVPLQALALLNGPSTERAASGLASRLLQAAKTDEERIVLAFRWLLTRAPREQETPRLLAFLADTRREHLAGKPANPDSEQAATLAAWRDLSLVLLNSNEFIFVP